MSPSRAPLCVSRDRDGDCPPGLGGQGAGMRLGLHRPRFSCVRGSFGKVWEPLGSTAMLCPVPGDPAVFCNTRAEGPGTILPFPKWDYHFGSCSLFSSLGCSEPPSRDTLWGATAEPQGTLGRCQPCPCPKAGASPLLFLDTSRLV